MPFVRFTPTHGGFAAPSDPLVDFLTAALAAENETPTAPKQKPAACQQRGPNGCARRTVFRPAKRIINPNFDISEHEHEYVLEGELPGVSDKSSISVDFDDAQTIVIKGEVKRASRAAKPKAEKASETQLLTEEALQASAASDVQSAEGETAVYESSDDKKKKRYSVTVEDEVDESETSSNASFEVVDGPLLTKADKGKAQAKEDVEMTEVAERPAQPNTAEKTAQKAPGPKYWIAERPIGVFERRFQFQGLIDQDNVRASLENGLLTVVVPKRQAYVRQVPIY